MRNLVIEDNHRLSQSLQMKLAHEGYSVDDGDVSVRPLRRKIDDPFATRLLTTVRGVGYRLQPPERG